MDVFPSLSNPWIKVFTVFAPTLLFPGLILAKVPSILLWGLLLCPFYQFGCPLQYFSYCFSLAASCLPSFHGPISYLSHPHCFRSPFFSPRLMPALSSWLSWAFCEISISSCHFSFMSLPFVPCNRNLYLLLLAYCACLISFYPLPSFADIQ